MSNEDTLRSLGKLITKPVERDAVHIAVAPAIADILLSPGLHVGLLLSGKASPRAVQPVGIVDPYLKTSVAPGEQFWLFLYPGSITSLNHHWTHPSFPTETEATRMKGEAEEWIRRWAKNTDIEGGYAEALEVAHAYLTHGEYLSDGGRYEGANVPDEFWEKYQIVTGLTIPSEKRGTFFSCSC